jgi:hypothetical protein
MTARWAQRIPSPSSPDLPGPPRHAPRPAGRSGRRRGGGEPGLRRTGRLAISPTSRRRSPGSVTSGVGSATSTVRRRPRPAEELRGRPCAVRRRCAWPRDGPTRRRGSWVGAPPTGRRAGSHARECFRPRPRSRSPTATCSSRRSVWKSSNRSPMRSTSRCCARPRARRGAVCCSRKGSRGPPARCCTTRSGGGRLAVPYRDHTHAPRERSATRVTRGARASFAAA